MNPKTTPQFKIKACSHNATPIIFHALIHFHYHIPENRHFLTHGPRFTNKLHLKIFRYTSTQSIFNPRKCSFRLNESLWRKERKKLWTKDFYCKLILSLTYGERKKMVRMVLFSKINEPDPLINSSNPCTMLRMKFFTNQHWLYCGILLESSRFMHATWDTKYF